MRTFTYSYGAVTARITVKRNVHSSFSKRVLTLELTHSSRKDSRPSKTPDGSVSTSFQQSLLSRGPATCRQQVGSRAKAIIDKKGAVTRYRVEITTNIVLDKNIFEIGTHYPTKRSEHIYCKAPTVRNSGAKRKLVLLSTRSHSCVIYSEVSADRTVFQQENPV